MAVERYPLAPLLALRPVSVTTLAEASGMDRAQLYRLIKAGEVNEWQADRLAIAIGVHPALVWPEWLEAGSGLVLEGVPIGPLLDRLGGGDLTARRLAAAAGVTRRSWFRWAAKGRIPPSAGEAICARFDIDPAELWSDWSNVRRRRRRRPTRRRTAA